LTELFLENNAAFLGFCQNNQPIDYIDLFLNYLSRHEKEKTKHAAYILIFALQEAYPLSNCDIKSPNNLGE